MEDVFEVQDEIARNIAEALRVTLSPQEKQAYFDLYELAVQLVGADADDVPQDMVYLGTTVKIKDLDDGEEMLVRLVGEAEAPDTTTEVQDVSATSPMGDALMKARVGETVTVKAPRGSMQFEVLEII